MSTETNFVGVFDDSYYQGIDDKALMYLNEDPDLSWLSQAIVTPLHAEEYKKPIYEESFGTKGAIRLGSTQDRMETPKSYKVYDLGYVYGDMAYDAHDMMTEGKYLLQRKSQEIKQWEIDMKTAAMQGVFSGGFKSGVGQGNRLVDGILEQSTKVEDLNGTDSLLDASGNVMKALDTMLGSIPFRIRSGHKVLIGCDDLLARKARSNTFRSSTSEMSEFDRWLLEHDDIAFKLPGQEIAPAKPLVSDLMFLNRVAGTTFSDADTVGTHSRLFMAVADPEVVELATSYVGMIGEDQAPLIGGLVQRYAAKMAGCVHEEAGVVYSEQIKWS